MICSSDSERLNHVCSVRIAGIQWLCVFHHRVLHKAKSFFSEVPIANNWIIIFNDLPCANICISNCAWLNSSSIAYNYVKRIARTAGNVLKLRRTSMNFYWKRSSFEGTHTVLRTLSSEQKHPLDGYQKMIKVFRFNQVNVNAIGIWSWNELKAFYDWTGSILPIV